MFFLFVLNVLAEHPPELNTRLAIFNKPTLPDRIVSALVSLLLLEITGMNL
jgi:hypothetical protein